VTVTVGRARAEAAGWVAEHAGEQPGYRGAFFTGSTVGLPAGAELSAASDVDVAVVTADGQPPVKPGKFRRNGVLVEVGYQPWAELGSPEAVLGSYHLAGSFRRDTVIDDPTGRLRMLHGEVAARFAEPSWVRRRCQDARHRVENGLASIDPAAPFHQQVTSWLFPTAVTTHVLLVAGLRNPTVRLRYARVRELLADVGQSAVYPELLDLLGGRDLPAARVQRQLDALAVTFDATAGIARTPFFFSGDISAGARSVAIDGSQELIDSGLHREAVFWILATFARCHTILAVDSPGLGDELAPALRSAVADLGITGTDDFRPRADRVRAFLPRLWLTAEAMIAEGEPAGSP
jgi:hypothetical protein